MREEASTLWYKLLKAAVAEEQWTLMPHVEATAANVK